MASYGAERFISACRAIGIGGLILTELPFEEKDAFQPLCRKYGVDLISLPAQYGKDAPDRIGAYVKCMKDAIC